MEVMDEENKGFSTFKNANGFECYLNYGENENILYYMYGTADEENYYLVHITITTNYYQNTFLLRTNAVKISDPLGQIARNFILLGSVENIMGESLDVVLQNLKKHNNLYLKDYCEIDPIKSSYEDLFQIKEAITFDALEKLGGKPRK